MNNWTISRRIIAGFTTMLLITVALGVFALWRLTGLAQNIADLGGQQPPERAGAEGGRQHVAGQPNFPVADRRRGSAERNTQLEQKIAANTARGGRVDQELRSSLISDDEDRRLFEEIKRARRCYDGIPQSRARIAPKRKGRGGSEIAARGRHPRL